MLAEPEPYRIRGSDPRRRQSWFVLEAVEEAIIVFDVAVAVAVVV
jgi:hypothetical protein